MVLRPKFRRCFFSVNFNATSYVKSVFRAEQTGKKPCLGSLSFSGTNPSWS